MSYLPEIVHIREFNAYTRFCGLTLTKRHSMPRELPKKLRDEPLVDAVFEVRFQGLNSIAVADVLPGSLYKEMGGDVELVRLPAADMPKPIRESDPQLHYVPIVRLDWKQFGVAIGDRCLVISCKLPYIGWSGFKSGILEVVNIIKSINVIGSVERYSVKYVNLLQAPDILDQIEQIRININIADQEIKEEKTSLRVEQHEDEILHIIQIITGAQGTIQNQGNVFGAILDIDSIKMVNAPSFPSFADALPENLENLRQSNKEKFFDCLTEEAVQNRGPIYE